MCAQSESSEKKQSITEEEEKIADEINDLEERKAKLQVRVRRNGAPFGVAAPLSACSRTSGETAIHPWVLDIAPATRQGPNS